MEKIEIRRVTSGDITALINICRNTFAETFSEFNTKENLAKYLDYRFSVEKLTGELNNDDSEFYFAVTGNQLIGYLKINTRKAQTESHDIRALEIERIYVLKEFQGKGVGRILYDKALEIALERRAGYIWLGVWENNKKALNFYRKIGFRQFDSHIFELGDSRQTDYLMKIDLA